MAEEETNTRIAELKARLEADPGSRVFYQLGEELRKSGRAEEAETVLRHGLETHSSYLSAWISLGRALKEMSRPAEAIEVLNRAFDLDRQNVVVARLLGESYSDTGEHVEAIKKYKLVAALHPADEEIQNRIQELESTLRAEGKFEERGGPSAPPPAPEPEPEPEPEFSSEPEPEFSSQPETALPFSDEESSTHEPEPFGEPEPASAEPELEPSDREVSASVTAEEETSWSPPAEVTSEPPASNEPFGLESPGGPGEEATEHESPGEGSTEPDDREPEREDHFADDSDVVATITMGDLYARQGHVEQAREIYRKILDRQPFHEDAQERLESLSEAGAEEPDAPSASISGREAKARRLELWLSKVKG